MKKRQVEIMEKRVCPCCGKVIHTELDEKRMQACSCCGVKYIKHTLSRVKSVVIR